MHRCSDKAVKLNCTTEVRFSKRHEMTVETISEPTVAADYLVSCQASRLVTNFSCNTLTLWTHTTVLAMGNSHANFIRQKNDNKLFTAKFCITDFSARLQMGAKTSSRSHVRYSRFIL